MAPDTFRAILEGRVPDGSGTELGKRGRDGEITHRPGRDLTFSAPKSVSIATLVAGDERIVGIHDRAVKATLAWVEKNAVETRMQDPETGTMVRAGNQKTVVATFRHGTSRNLDPQLHTHSVLANMVRGEDGEWRTMANERLYECQKLIGAIYRNELAAGLAGLGYAIEKTHADGRFEIAGVSREAIRAFSTRRAEIEAAMAERDLGETADNPRHAERAALMTRATKREVDRDELRQVWQRQAAELGLNLGGFSAETCDPSVAPGQELGAELAPATDGLTAVESRVEASPEPAAGVARQDRETVPAPSPQPGTPARRDRGVADAVTWAMAHLSEREAVFSRADLLAAALAYAPGTLTIEAVEREMAGLEKAGTLHAVNLPGAESSLATDRTVGEERETIALMRAGEARGKAPMRRWVVQEHLHRGPLTAGQKDAVTLILTARDRVIGVQGYAGTGKTTMLDRARTLTEKKGWRMLGLAPSASAVKTLAAEAGIESQTLQGFLARNAGVAEGRLTRRGAREMRATFSKTVLVVDEGSLASTVQARNLLRIADALRIPRVVLVGDAKQLDAVDAGKPFAQLQKAGMPTAVMDEIMRQRDPALKEAVEASLAGGDPPRFRQARRQRHHRQVARHRRRGRRALARACPRGTGEDRGHGAESQAPPPHQRSYPRGTCARGPPAGPGDGDRAAGLEGIHPGGEGPRRQLREGRFRCLLPLLQAHRRREGGRTPRRRRGWRAPGGPARRRQGRLSRLETFPDRRQPGRH